MGGTQQLAAAIGVTFQTVHQWRKDGEGSRPVPIGRCAAIEAATKGAVSRRDLRPNDWHLIWPELIGKKTKQAA